MSPGRKHSFIRSHLGRWTVSVMCRVLGVSEQGYYRSLRRPERGWRDRQLLEQICECLRDDEENGCNYCKNRHPSPICTRFEHHLAGVLAPLPRTEAPKPYNWFSTAKL